MHEPPLEASLKTTYILASPLEKYIISISSVYRSFLSTLYKVACIEHRSIYIEHKQSFCC